MASHGRRPLIQVDVETLRDMEMGVGGPWPSPIASSSPLRFHRQIPLRLRNLGLDIDWIGDGERREGEVN